MNTLHRNEFVGTIVPDFYTAEDTTATAVVIKAPASTVTITGRALSRSLCGTTAAQRAALAALAMDGDLIIVNPTVGQITRLYEISHPTLNKARALPTDDARFRVAAGVRPLVTAQDRANEIVSKFYSDFDIVHLINAIGPDRVMNVFDWMTLPETEAAE